MSATRGLALGWLLATLVFCPTGLFGRPPDEEGKPVILGHELTLESERLGHARRIFVSAPDGVSAGAPVLVVLDGHRLFGMAASTARFLAEQGVIPPMLVVGVANDVDRGHYLTPSFDRWISNSGGADAFLGFLEAELLPLLEARYRPAPFRVLAGASFGGIFTLHALSTRPDLFHAYLMISPSVHMGQGRLYEELNRHLDDPLPQPRFVFLSLADERNELRWEQEMRTEFDRLVELFDYRAETVGWRFATRDYPDETHASTKLIALYDGLRALYEHWPVPEFRQREGLEGLERHYEQLTSELGYPVAVPEQALLQLGYRHLEEGRVPLAVEVFRFATQLHPRSPNVWDSLGEGLEAAGELEAARRAFLQAVETAEDSGHEREDLYRARRAAFERRHPAPPPPPASPR